MPENFKKQISSAVQDLASQLTSHVADAEKRARQAEKKLAGVQTRMEREVQSRRERLDAVRQSERKLKRERRKLTTRIEKLSRKLEELSEEKSTLETRSETLGEHVQLLKHDHHTSTDLLEHAHLELTRRRREVNSVKADSEMRLQEQKEACHELESRLAEADKKLQKANRRRADALKKVRRLSRRNKEQEAALTAAGEKHVALQDDIEQARKEKADADAALSERDAQQESTDAELKQARKSIAQQTARLASATEMTQSLRRELAEVRDKLSDEAQKTKALMEKPSAARKKGGRGKSRVPFLRRPARVTPGATHSAPSEGWLTRSPDGAIYGPATIETLTEWAADCRIGPDHDVSPDGTNWKPAPEFPELEMDQSVELVDGRRYGPVHRDAVQHIIAAGFAGPETTGTSS